MKTNKLSILGRTGGEPSPLITDKRWGQEETIFNEEYCCKILAILPSQETSSHFHVLKHETLFLASGELIIIWQTRDCEEQESYLIKNEAFIIPPGMIHKLIAGPTGAIIVESSTHDDAEDSIRVKF